MGTYGQQPRKKVHPALVGSVLVLLASLIVVIIVVAAGGGDDQTPADPTKLDQAGQLACDDFARGVLAAQTRQARIDLANKVNKWAARSDTNRIADMGASLGRGADGSEQAWDIASDAFATACMDAGWGK